MATHYAKHRYDEIASTQDEARLLFARADETVPILVVAGRQVGGRGRSGNRWIHAPRAMAASLALRPQWPDDTLGTVPLVIGMAARDAIRDQFGLVTSLKWPNDVMLGEAKVGGVLVEASGGVIVAGCGINVQWPHPPDGFGALERNDPGPDAVEALADVWATAVMAAVDAGPGAWDRGAYRSACSTIGRDIVWDPAGHGHAVDIAADGGLVVRTDTGLVTLRSGEVRTVRAATLQSSDVIDRGADRQ